MGIASFNQVKGVYFDAGGTLLHPHPSVGEIYSLVLERWGVRTPAGMLEPAFRAAWKRMTHQVKDFISEETEKRWWKTLVRETLKDSGMPADFEPFFEDLYLTFASPECWKLFDGAAECLRTLKAAGYRVGILSNWDHRLRRILEGTSLLPELDEVVISSEVGSEKPSLEIFQEGARRWGLRPEELLYVGDSYYHDIEPCQKLGWSTVLIHPREEPPAPVAVVKSFTEVSALLGVQVRE